MSLDSSRKILRDALDQFNPTHIVSMVSGGKDSAASDQVARELGVKIDFVMHGNTRCGIPETSQFVQDTYGKIGDFVEADAGTNYEDYVFRKGFFGKGRSCHTVAYHILKSGPFDKALSKHIRKRKRGVRIMLLTGARREESENRRQNLKPMMIIPSRPNNAWVPLTLHWSHEDRDTYLESRNVPINPVAKALCRSGECMCGTMQTKAERVEASVLYPHWGSKLDALEKEVKAIHGYGWGEPFPRPPIDDGTVDMFGSMDFQPMCSDCVLRGAA